MKAKQKFVDKRVIRSDDWGVFLHALGVTLSSRVAIVLTPTLSISCSPVKNSYTSLISIFAKKNTQAV